MAIVMPEIGFDELPISPVMRDDTVTKKKPKSTTRTAARTLPCVGAPGLTTRKTASSSEPTEHDGQRHVAIASARAFDAAGGAEVLHALAERRDDRRDRARQRDQAGRQHGAGADVADVRAPQLLGDHLIDAGRPLAGTGGQRHGHVVAEIREQRQAAPATRARRRRTSRRRCAGRSRSRRPGTRATGRG